MTKHATKPKNNLRFLNIPVTAKLDDEVEKTVTTGLYVSKSDMVRDSVRKKLAELGIPKETEES